MSHIKRRTFITELATAEIRGQQSSTLLGELWALVDPVFQAAIYYFLFTVIRGSSGGTKSDTDAISIIVSGVNQAPVNTVPGMQGTELAAALRKLNPTLPVVIMSGYFSKISPHALDELGQVELLAKPFTTDELAHAVHRALYPDK